MGAILGYNEIESRGLEVLESQEYHFVRDMQALLKIDYRVQKASLV